MTDQTPDHLAAIRACCRDDAAFERLLGLLGARQDASPTADHCAPLDEMPLGVFITDAAGQIVEANRLLLEMTGFSRAELDGYPALALFSEPDVADAAGFLFYAFEQDAPGGYETIIKRNDDSSFFARLHLSPRHDDTGGFFGWLVSVEDAGRLQRTEAELRAREARYRLVADSATDMISICDEDGVFLFVSPACETLLGYRPGELQGRSLVDLLHSEDAERVAADLQHTLTSRERHVDSYRVQRKDGAYVWFETVSRAVDDPLAGAVRLHGVSRDVTERRRREEERERLIEDLNAFAHTVAHDLKHPLNVMMGYAEIVLEDHPELPIDVVSDMNLIIRSGRKMHHIIAELLRLAEFHHNGPVELAPLNMPAIVEETLQRLTYLIDEHEANVIVPDEWPSVPGYAPWIEEVWANYISNAIKYGGTPPQVLLGSSELEDGRVSFWVRDNGPGLSSAEQARLFQRFSRLDRERASGHGLGLSIVKRIVERLGGAVGVESAPGRGSRFYFALPAGD